MTVHAHSSAAAQETRAALISGSEDPNPTGAARLIARRAGIDTYQAAIVYMRADCEVCRAEGFGSQARVEIGAGGRSLIATVHHVLADWLQPGEAGLSESAWRSMGLRDGDPLDVRHPPVLESERHIRSKVYGVPLDHDKLLVIMRDVAANRLSDLHLATFVSACAGDRLNRSETIALTRAMIDVGHRLAWSRGPVVDKHCVGGLPGNRTSPLVVSIVTACGAVMPKTSSRAITSPAGTADTMETLAPVDLDLATLRRVVEREGGCLVWGGAVQLSPADDVLIRVERPLDLDSTGQMVASVLSKKASAGSQRVLIDIPVGPTAKVRSAAAADVLAGALTEVGSAVGLQVHTVQTDGSQPVGRGIGPALEAWDLLAVLRCEVQAPRDLRDRALLLAAGVLEMADLCPAGAGLDMARRTLDSGRAWAKFQAICAAQGGLRQPPVAAFVEPWLAPAAGTVLAIDNRRIAMAAKLAGAPAAPAAGVAMAVRLGDPVQRGQPLFSLHAQSRGELAYAQAYVASQAGLITVGEVS
ncbi:thymidine phosphorylase family protein [Ramlibacter sp. AW1]|uniref:Putative thymidine phosphorylase n=1 Tax=Ramlibacter aurantiacus TaxID=2801330 RepID=A0A937D7C3_9BURK|nr:thymidine phosphorylase family protein [Ramlibacter aurantiacus]MBL0420786.1 thymidine phosphorylase family protein [Ramlibacter aurantiacus]